MAIFVAREGNRWRIDVSGRFDFSCRGDFRAAYSGAPTGTSFLIDMNEVEYVDSAALGMLLLLRDHAGDASRVSITGASGQPEQVLKIANFHRLFRFE